MGQAVAFEVVDEVKVQGVTVIAREAQALGTVTMAQGKRRMARGGKLSVNLDSVCLVDGEKAALRATASGKGGGPVVEMTTMMVLTGVLFLPAAPLFLLKHGKDVTIPEGTELTGFVSGDVLLDMAKFVPVAAPGTTAAGAALLTTLAVDSSIAESDIEVDGVFVGKTPSTIAVTPGQHTIAVKKKGYSDWSRLMNVAGTGATLTAELEVKPSD